MREAEIVPRAPEARLEGHGLLERRQGVGQPARLGVQERERVGVLGIGRLQFRGLDERRLRFAVLPPGVEGEKWSGRPDSNRRRPAWEAGILPLNYGRPALFILQRSRRRYFPSLSDIV